MRKMIPGLQSLWFILTVIIPGMVFYSTLRILIWVLGIEAPFFTSVDSAEILTLSIVLACGILLQVIAIVLESLAFTFGPYKHADSDVAAKWEPLGHDKVAGLNEEKRVEYEKAGKQHVWNKRYDILGTMTQRNESQVEYLLAQFFMSHNVAIGMIAHSAWVLLYMICNTKLGLFNHQLIAGFLVSLTVFSGYIPYNRFKTSSQVLFEFYQENIQSESLID